MRRIDSFSLATGAEVQLQGEGWVETNGERVEVRFNTTRYPLWKLQATLNKNCVQGYSRYSTLASPMPHYTWDGTLNFLQASGNEEYHVEYDHINNVFPTGVGLYYNWSYNEGKPSYTHGDHVYVAHIPKYQLKDAKEYLNLWSIIAGVGAVGSAFYYLLCSMGIIIGHPVTAAAVGLILVVLALIGVAVEYFVEDVLETENDDGFGYMWDATKTWLPFRFYLLTLWMSFGKWRDWGWYFWFLGWQEGSGGGGGGGSCRLR